MSIKEVDQERMHASFINETLCLTYLYKKFINGKYTHLLLMKYLNKMRVDINALHLNNNLMTKVAKPLSNNLKMQ